MSFFLFEKSQFTVYSEDVNVLLSTIWMNMMENGFHSVEIEIMAL